MKKRFSFRSIQGKIILCFLFTVMLTSLLSGIMQYRITSKMQLEELKSEVSRIASAAALLIDGDKHDELNHIRDKNADEYHEIIGILRKFKDDTQTDGVYTLIKKGNNTEFILDADEEPAEIGYTYDLYSEMEEAFNGVSSSDEEFYTDEWETVISGYAPIKNNKGGVVGIVGVDIDVSHIKEQRNQLIAYTGIVMLISILISLALSVLFSRRLTKPIKILSNRLEELSTSGGDLTQSIDIKTGDELEDLGNSFNKFIENIREIVKEIYNIGREVGSSSESLNSIITQNQVAVEEVANAIQEIAGGVSQQAADINNVSSRVEKIATDINENDNKIEEMNTSMDITNKLINRGMKAADYQSKKTEENVKAFKNVKAAVDMLSKEAEDTGDILSKITKIAEQTNLLALNAAIEAARAGETGRGFAVVADEVRKLAEDSKKSADEIYEILNRVGGHVQNTMAEIDIVDDITKEQMKAIENTNNILENISTEATNVSNKLNDIRHDFTGIRHSTDDIAGAVQSIASVSEENAAITEEVSASSEEQSASMEEIGITSEGLENLSSDLNQIISKFTI